MPVGDYVLDNGLSAIDTLGRRIYLCHTLPTTYTEATSTYAVGNKDFGVGGVTGAPAAASPNGRKVTTNAVADGSVTATNASPGAGFWAVVDDANSRLLAAFSLAAAQPVTNGNSFQLPAFDIRLPGA
jgi:hypothetical protein